MTNEEWAEVAAEGDAKLLDQCVTEMMRMRSIISAQQSEIDNLRRQLQDALSGDDADYAQWCEEQSRIDDARCGFDD